MLFRSKTPKTHVESFTHTKITRDYSGWHVCARKNLAQLSPLAKVIFFVKSVIPWLAVFDFSCFFLTFRLKLKKGCPLMGKQKIERIYRNKQVAIVAFIFFIAISLMKICSGSHIRYFQTISTLFIYYLSTYECFLVLRLSAIYYQLILVKDVDLKIEVIIAI